MRGFGDFLRVFDIIDFFGFDGFGGFRRVFDIIDFFGFDGFGDFYGSNLLRAN